MKKMRAGRAILAAVMILILGCAALAELDLAKEGSIGVRIHTGQGVNVENARIELFLVGQPVIRNNNLCFDPTPDFAPAGLNLDDVNNPALPEKIQKFARENGAEPWAKQSTDENGWVRFQKLPVGLYAVVQNGFDVKNPAFTEIKPFMIMLPMTQDGDWAYEIEASPKAGARPVPTDTPKPTKPPEDEKIPQTGMLRWPVLALACGGVLLFSLGWALCFMGKRKKKNA